MPNNYFRFRQFTIRQQHCAMKVCTDACLFGAWVAALIGKNKLPVHQLLDIGTGTGLLSLQIAQQTATQIDALEVDADAATQAKENFENSPWSQRLNLVQTDARRFIATKKYDLIISNPPFFDNDLKSKDHQRNLALHSEAMNLEELLVVINNNLSSDGYFAVLLPYHRMDLFEQLALGAGFHLRNKLLVRQTPKHNFFRGMLFFSKLPGTAVVQEIYIKEGVEYSSDFVSLLKEYYLYV